MTRSVSAHAEVHVVEVSGENHVEAAEFVDQLALQKNGIVFIKSGYPRNGALPRNALLAFRAE